jgi:hypothetical protein
MQQAQSRARARRWTGRGALVALAGPAGFGISPALPALAAGLVGELTTRWSCRYARA